METQPWILVTVAILVLLLLVVAIVMRRKEKRPPDYYAFFLMGLVWFALGAPLRNWPMTALGAVFLVVGLVNKDKWETNRKSWDKMSETEKRLKISLLVILGALVLLGLILFIQNGSV